MNTIELPELTNEALEELLSDKMFSLFLNNETKDIIRKRFEEAKKIGFDNQKMFIKEAKDEISNRG